MCWGIEAPGWFWRRHILFTSRLRGWIHGRTELVSVFGQWAGLRGRTLVVLRLAL